MASASTAYTSAAVNRHSYAASICSSQVAFGSSTYVALWDVEDPTDRGVYQTLPGHEGLITAIRFLQDGSFISADDEGFLSHWTKSDDKWTRLNTISAHKNAISSLAVHQSCIVSGASDSQVKVWNLTEEGIQSASALSLGSRYPLAVELTTLPNSSTLILAIGITDRSVQIWTRSDDNFVQAAVLAGHEDWVKSLSFRPLDALSDCLTLASGSQDGTIRLWNIQPRTKSNTSPSVEGDDLLDAFEDSLGDLTDAEEGGLQISLKRHIVTIKDKDNGLQQFTVTFDALLIGHEAGVTSLAWRPSSEGFHDSQTLLSTSTDSSVILWSPSTVISASKEGTTSLWINRQRFGDVGGQRLGGFVGGLWGRGGREVLAWGWNGGWRRWRQRPSTLEAQQSIEDWEEIGAVTGHSGPVRGVSWSNNGEYLISTSLDQTTRIHGAVPVLDTSNSIWTELSRPQVHGYDLIDAVFLTPTRFISIADEKVARVFEAPKEFVTSIATLHVADLAQDQSERPRAATVPPLGLSNKATVETAQEELPKSERSDRRPFEGELAVATLWPEIEKVFGHGYESIALAASNNKQLVATACKATSADHAVVRVYDTTKWQIVGEPLTGHTLTITKIAFSPDDKYILSVSRDRTWRLFKRAAAEGGYHPIVADKSHARIIWDCDWAHEGDIFATASRDKSIKIWSLENLGSQKWTAAATIKLQEAATAVAFSAEDSDARRRMAVGLENGEILVFSGSRTNLAEWTEDLRLDARIAHVDQIHRLAWRPGSKGGVKQLASCSKDGTLKVLLIHTGMI